VELCEEKGKRINWAFIAEDQFQRKVLAGQNIGREDQITIQAAVSFDEVTSSALSKL